MVLVLVCALAGGVSWTVIGARGEGRDRRRGGRLDRHRARAAARVPRAGPLDLHRDARRRGAVRRVDVRRRCWPRSPSAAGCSSGSTPASAPPRRPRDAARHVPRAIWIALLSVGALVILNAVAVTLAHPEPARGRGGRGPGPGHHRRGHLVRVLVGQAVRRRGARGVPGLRDGGAGTDGPRRSTRSRATTCFPPPASCAAWTARRAPIGAIAVTAVVACLGLLLGLELAAVGSLIAFGTAAIYVAFLLIALGRADRPPARDLGRRATSGWAAPGSWSTSWRWRGWRSRP